MQAMLQRPFESHSADQNKCIARVCGTLVNLAQLLLNIRATLAARSRADASAFLTLAS